MSTITAILTYSQYSNKFEKKSLDRIAYLLSFRKILILIEYTHVEEITKEITLLCTNNPKFQETSMLTCLLVFESPLYDGPYVTSSKPVDYSRNSINFLLFTDYCFFSLLKAEIVFTVLLLIHFLPKYMLIILTDCCLSLIFGDYFSVYCLQNTVYSGQCNTNLIGSSIIVYPFPVSQRRQAAVITYVGQEFTWWKSHCTSVSTHC